MTRSCPVRAYTRTMPERVDTPKHRELIASDEVVTRLCVRALEKDMERTLRELDELWQAEERINPAWAVDAGLVG
jgi:hypothetical protein